MVVHACNPRAQEAEAGSGMFKTQQVRSLNKIVFVKPVTIPNEYKSIKT